IRRTAGTAGEVWSDAGQHCPGGATGAGAEGAAERPLTRFSFRPASLALLLQPTEEQRPKEATCDLGRHLAEDDRPQEGAKGQGYEHQRINGRAGDVAAVDTPQARVLAQQVIDQGIYRGSTGKGH